jgi:transketolase
MSPSGSFSEVDQLAINTIRFLAVDMVQKANSGHPGAPMGQAAMAYLLWTRHLRHCPTDPQWPDRDRFVLSAGHASALLYALLHLSGYDLPLDEIRKFRQLHSKTPGHPEHGLTAGVETTTGPLGQGIGNAVGMAIAQRMMAARYDREGHQLFDHRVWTIAGDGDLQEGVASEACSLAGHLRLGRLNLLYDDNGISIDGPTSLSFSEDVAGRFAAYGWHTLRVEDGNDLTELDAAMSAAAAETERPTIVLVRTHIGYGSPNKQDTSAAHGSPLGPDEVALTKEALGWPREPTFHVPDEALAPFAAAREAGERRAGEWGERLEAYADAYPAEAEELRRRLAGELPEGWRERIPAFSTGDGNLATHKASGKVLNAIAEALPELVGGSADLTPSNNTFLAGRGDHSADEPDSPNLRFGIREHGMGAVMNGLALAGGFVPYGGTFLVFSDYMRPSVRLAALMEQRAIYVFTHDSIFLGEDGPTHQPIAQLAALRAIPNLAVIRPADANETAAAWALAIERTDGPTALALTRQGVPVLSDDSTAAREGTAKGGYVVADPDDGEPELILVATGSEVATALGARRLLAEREIAVRVVSLPCWSLFDAQPREYRDAVLPPAIDKRLAIEAGSPLGWERYVGTDGEILGIDRFGASAPYGDLSEEYGFTAENVARRAVEMARST